MTKTTKYLVYDINNFTKVNEKEYNRWLKENWNKFEPPMFSKLIGGIVYTVQAFYHGDITMGSRFKPFTLYYLEGKKHKIRFFRKWITFKNHYDKLIGKLELLEIQHFSTGKMHRFMAADSVAMVASAR